ncbi:MAG: hypothetical protein HY738_18840 [Bacteroidia bacterium]|nr:hypothetical protein [Bacteroidia bacterium]
MNREQFIEYLNHPEMLDNTSISEITSLLAEYPYFQTAHLLLAKGFHNQGDIKYDQQIKLTAAYITDRKVLYHLINSESQDVTKKSQIISEQIPTGISKQPAFVESADIPKQPAFVEPADIPKQPAFIEQFDKLTVTPAEVQKPPVFVEQFDKLTVTPAETQKPSAFVEPADVPKQPVFVEQFDKCHGEPVEPLTVTPVEIIKEQIIEESPIQKSEAEAEYTPKPAITSTVEADIDEPKEDLAIFQFDFTAAAEGDIEEEIIQTEGSESYSFSEWLGKLSSKQAPVSQKNIEKQSDILLIDKFIKNDAKITIQDASSDDNSDMSAMSIIEDEGLITETLVKIYIKQGFLEKALRAYEKLYLKYPEKSTYFASQIEKLQQQYNKS